MQLHSREAPGTSSPSCLQVYVMTLSFLAALLPAALPNVAVVIGAVCYISLVSLHATSDATTCTPDWAAHRRPRISDVRA